MTPKEIKLSSWRTEAASSEIGVDMDVTLDTTEALRDQAAVNQTTYQDETRQWRNKKI